MPKDLIRVDLDPVYPPFIEKMLQVLANCRERGAEYFWTSGYRSPQEQLALWQKGRNKAGAVVEPKAVVTRVKFGLHNLGLAGDCTRDVSPKKGLQPSWSPEHYQVLAEEAEKVGLEAGHRWKWRDSPHLQLPISKYGLTISKIKAIHDKGGLSAVWAYMDTVVP